MQIANDMWAWCGRFACSGALAVGLLTASSSAWAQGAPNTAAAEALFREGKSLMDQGRFAEACPKLAASQRIDPGAGTLLNLAACYEKNGQSASAWATYREAAAAAERSERDDWAKIARERAAQIEPTLSRLSIMVPPTADVPGLVIERDGIQVDRAQWGSAIPVDPGAHPVTATAPRKQLWSTTVSVGPHAASVTVTLPPLQIEQSDDGATAAAAPVATTASPNASTDTGTSDGSTQRVAGIVVAGVGVVGLGLGTYFGLKAKSTHDDALSQCAGNLCTAEGIGLDDDARSHAMVSTIAFGFGAAAVVGGAVLYLTAPSSDGAAAVAIGAAPTPGGAALSMRGAW